MKINKVNEMSNSEEIVHVDGKIVNNSLPVACNRKISQWLIDKSMTSRNDKNLYQNLILELTELFGAQNKTLRLEFMTKLWILKYKDLTFNVFTAKGKGTSIEVCDLEYEDIRVHKYEKDIIDFLKKLHELINK